MLVLSRRPSQKILFPHLGISVEVLRVNGNTVRLGVAAPDDVQVIREEIAGQHQARDRESLWSHLPSKLRHALRNRLNTAVLGLHLLHCKLEAGELDDAEAAVFTVFRELEAMDADVAGLVADPDRQIRSLPARRVLLVDDSRAESALLAGYLRSFNYEVDTAFDGVEAIAYLDARDKPDVVLLDMQMPKLDGAGTIQRIRANPALDGIRVFGVSGLSPGEAGVEIGAKGVDRWFTKPINPNELLAEIGRDLVMLT